MYKNESSANDFLLQVNKELDDSFNNRNLVKSNETFINNYLPIKDSSEVNEVIDYEIDDTLLYSDISVNTSLKDSSLETRDNATFKHFEKYLNEKLFTQNDENNSQMDLGVSLANKDINLYQSLAYVILALSVFGFIGLIINQILNKFENRHLNAY